MNPLRELARQALEVQDACNLTAVVTTFADALEGLWEYASKNDHGTDWVNQHPITRAFISKLMSLSGHERGDGVFAHVIHMAGAAEPAPSI